MDLLPVFVCYHCHKQTGNPHTSLDRRTVRRFQAQGGATLQILNDQSLFTYCDLSCWQQHELVVMHQLELESAYPAAKELVPCNRCGAPVLRTEPHISYAVTTMRLTDAPDSYVGEVLWDDDFAVLCRGCETPEEIASEEMPAEVRART